MIWMVFTVGRHYVSIRGHGDEVATVYVVSKSRQILATFRAPMTYALGATMVSPWLVLWSGAVVVAIDVDADVADPGHFDADGDVLAVFAWNTSWIIVSELRVERRSADLRRQEATYSLPDVIVDASWSQDALVVSDFNGTTARLNPASLTPF